MSTPGNYHFLRKFPDKCCAETTRGGESQPCDKTAVAVTAGEDQWWWPVCAYHTRGRQMVPLAMLLALCGPFIETHLCSGCDCPKARCDAYGPGQKCCPGCRHTI